MTTDFVILTASVLMLALSFGAVFSDGVETLVQSVVQVLDEGEGALEESWE